MADLARLCTDAQAEHDALRTLLNDLGEGDWDRPTPAPGWTIRDQISHLAYFDDACRLAVAEPEQFVTARSDVMADIDAFVDRMLAYGRGIAGHELLDRFSAGRSRLLKAVAAAAAAAAAAAGTRVPWYGPDMSLASAVTARIMETWAHGQDVADALGAALPPTARLRHVCELGTRTMAHSFRTRGLEPPEGAVRVELDGPGGERWTWGETGGDDVVRGSALDFCLIVTQRRHVADTDLAVEGPVARAWIDIAQAFAGPPGPGRQPGQFRSERAGKC